MVYVVLLLLLLLAFFAYFCTFLMRIVSLFTDRKTVKRTVGIIAGIVIFAGGTAVFGFVVPVSLFYVIAIGAVCQLVYALFGKKLPEFAGVLYRSGIIPVVLTVVIMVSGVSTMKDIQRTEYTLKSDKVSEKTKIVFLSDVHLGTTMDIKGFYKLSERIADEKPDAIIIGGDWFDQGTTNEDMFTAAAIMGNIKTENGVYYVYGNHDMDTGVFVPFEDFGVTVLEDEVANCGELAVVGRMDASVDYLGKNRKPLKELVGETDKSRFIINADHQPKELEESGRCGVNLQLSGHTHSGQFFPFGYLSEWLGINEMNYGIRKDGDFTAITSSGAGGWGLAVRTQGVSEYVCINIVPEKQ